MKFNKTLSYRILFLVNTAQDHHKERISKPEGNDVMAYFSTFLPSTGYSEFIRKRVSNKVGATIQALCTWAICHDT